MPGEILGVVAGHLHTQSSALSSTVFGPILRDATYAANRVGVRLSPPPDAVLAAYWSGRLGEVGGPVARRVRDTLLNEHGLYWDGNAAVGTSLDNDLPAGGYLPLRGSVWRSYVDLSQPWPDWEILHRGYLRGSLGAGEGIARAALTRRGITRTDWQDLYLELGSDPQLVQLLEWRRRGWIDDAEWTQLIRWAGLTSPRLTELYRQQLDAELLDPRQAIEAVWRLSTEQQPRYQLVGELPAAFTESARRQTLAARGYSNATQETLVSLSRPQVQHRQSVQGVSLGIRDRTFVESRARAEGYLPDDVSYFGDLAEIHRDEPHRAKLIQAIELAYEIGTLQPADAQTQLQQMGLSTRGAQWALTAIDSRHTLRLVQETINELRRALLDGTYSTGQVAAYLVALGIQPERVNQYMLLWEVQHSTRQRHLATGEILGLVRSGHLDPVTAQVRLTNLGWVQPDQVLLLDAAEQSLLQRQAAQQQALAREGEAASKRAAALAVQAQRQADQLLQRARREEPLRDLVRFFKDGVLTEPELRTKLTDQRYEKEYIDWLIADATRPKGAPRPKQPAAAKKQPAAGGLKGETISTLGKLVKGGIIDVATYADRLREEQYPEELVQWLTELVTPTAPAPAIETAASTRQGKQSPG